MGTAGIQDKGKTWLRVLQLCWPFHCTHRLTAYPVPFRSQFRCQPHLIPPWGGGVYLPLEEDGGSSFLVDPSPSLATQNAHVSTYGASGCEKSPGEE